MNGPRRKAPLLVLGIGNPSRGDDALGPSFVERLETVFSDEIARGEVELLTDFQLQVEHALDLMGRRRVVFVDASVSAAPPFALHRVVPRRESGVSTHAMSPGGVLEVHRRTFGEPPEAWVLGVRGERFELGEPLSERASMHLERALSTLVEIVREGRWERPQSAQARALVEPQRSDEPRVGARFEIAGTVQGVGFRPWIYRVATRLELAGVVRNTPGGATIEAFGRAQDLRALEQALSPNQANEIPAKAPREASWSRARTGDRPPSVVIHSVSLRPIALSEGTDFTIGDSDTIVDPRGSRSLSIPPDLGTCAACSSEVGNPTDRHFGYPFTSCVDCGPRFSMIVGLPYDRATTTMARFSFCEVCAAEYARPDDRRFHAEAIACPACGPRAWLADERGDDIPTLDVFAAASELLTQGKILAVQGLGAFHLVCDATSSEAVRELRRRKRREAQPFAVMVPDQRSAESLVWLDEGLRAALLSPARPIVLAPSKPRELDGAPELSPWVNGPSRRTGVMLPYTPLHELLMARVARPLVFTSGNLSGGPAIVEPSEAKALLGPLVSGFLFHDRPIARRVEDSVVVGSKFGVRVARRSRGLVPSPIRLPARAPSPVLAVGGHLKNTACLVVDDLAYLTPHYGDLGTLECESAWRSDVEALERLFGVHADVLAHDLHPDYVTTRYALARPSRRCIGVQHHVAHALAAMAELHVHEPVIAAVFDGSGFGTDGTSWGSEVLVVDGGRWTRASSWRPLDLPGGERAIRETWRVAFSALCAAFGEEEALALAPRLRVFDGQAQLGTVARMIATGVSTVKARGMGRWFDAIGALVLGLPHAGFEGHVALALEEAGTPVGVGAALPYPVTLPTSLALGREMASEHEVDLRPTVRAVVSDLLAGVDAGLISARFHQTIVLATTQVVARALEETGLRRIVLSGGSFQNRVLEEGVVSRLGEGRVSMAREVPVNDGGLALGQAWAAVLALRAEGT